MNAEPRVRLVLWTIVSMHKVGLSHAPADKSHQLYAEKPAVKVQRQTMQNH